MGTDRDPADPDEQRAGCAGDCSAAQRRAAVNGEQLGGSFSGGSGGGGGTPGGGGGRGGRGGEGGTRENERPFASLVAAFDPWKIGLWDDRDFMALMVAGVGIGTGWEQAAGLWANMKNVENGDGVVTFFQEGTGGRNWGEGRFGDE